MPAKIQQEITDTFEIEGLGELLVTYEMEIIQHPMTVEEGHGLHYFNEDEITKTFLRAEVVIGKKGIDITHLLDKRQKEFIEEWI